MSWIFILLLWTSVAMGAGCPRGFFWNASTSYCSPCPPGSYQFAMNATKCKPCGLGRYNPVSGAQSKEVCLTCPEGTYSNVSVASSCIPCSKGTYSHSGAVGCGSCSKGTIIGREYEVTDENGCRPCDGGYADEENLIACKGCPTGFSAPPGSSSIHQCVACPPGTSSDGRSACFECRNGQYSETPGSPCKLCPRGYVGENYLGSTKCIPCKPGEFGRILYEYYTVAECFTCPENTTSFTFGRRLCRRRNGPCPHGYIQTSSGDCERCEIDERYDLKLQRCVACPPGEGSIGGLPLKCAPCTDVVKAGVKQSKCLPYRFKFQFAFVNQTCPPGTSFEDTEYGRICLYCDSSYYSSKSNSTECLKCPNGTIALGSAIGGTRCEACPSNMVTYEDRYECRNPKTGCSTDTKLAIYQGERTNCIPNECSANEHGGYICPPCTRYSDNYSFDGCTVCPKNQVRNLRFECTCGGELAQNVGIINGTCSVCPAGSFGKSHGREENNTCVLCPAGTYRHVWTYQELVDNYACRRCNGSPPCKWCPRGFVTRHDGATKCEKCPPGTFSYGLGDTECLAFGAPPSPVHFNDPLDKKLRSRN